MKNTLTKYSEFPRNAENPFAPKAIEEINKCTVKKYQTATSTDKKAIFQAVDTNGEIVGHTSFIRQRMVDNEEFIKVYRRGFKSFFDLSERASRIFWYVSEKLLPNKNEFIFILEECMEYTGYKNKTSVYSGLAELISKEVIAKGRTDSIFYINPLVMYNGDRVAFTQIYENKDRKKTNTINKQKDSNIQLDFFNSIK